MCPIPSGVLLFCQVFGGFPLKYVIGKNGETSLKFSIVVFLWGLAVVTFQTVGSWSGLYIDYMGSLKGQPVRMGSHTATVAVTLDISSLNVMAMVFFFSYTWRFRRFIAIYDLLGRIDTILQLKTHLVESRVRVILIFSSTLTIMSLSVYMDIENPSTYTKSANNNQLSVYTPVITIYFAQAALSVNFSYVAQNLAYRFRVINRKIKTEVISKTFGGFAGNQCLPTVDVTPGDPSVVQLRRVIYCYWLLCDVVHEANIFYCCQLLVSIFVSFLHSIITLYYMFLHMDHGLVSYLTYQGIWVFIHIFNLTLLVWNCTTVTEAVISYFCFCMTMTICESACLNVKANETGPTICKRINRDMHPWTRTQLEILLPQLLHHNARFTALGLFQVNNRILTSVNMIH
ncbi:gustatory receptor [Homalodisca vitripennis]|nr:gustatory receptor [Homalodisca vitripennis]